MKKIAIFCPFYITNNNNAKWINKWNENIAKFVSEYDIYYSISYPSMPDKWDLQSSNMDAITSISSYILDINSIHGNMLFMEPNIEHCESLYRIHKHINNTHDYLIHIEQDVILYSNIIPSLINICESDDNNIVIASTKPIRGGAFCDIDISVFCVNLHNVIASVNLYEPLLCDNKYNINIFNNKEITIDKSIKIYYNELLSHLYASDNNFIQYMDNTTQFDVNINEFKKWTNPYSGESNSLLDIKNILFIDTARKLIIDSYINKKLGILKNDNLFVHIGNSRIISPDCINYYHTCNLKCNACSLISNSINNMNKNNYHESIKLANLITINNNNPIEASAIFCPFYISKSNNGEWINKWIHSIGIIETLPKYYSIVYSSDVDINEYSDLINKLNSVATCIGIYENLYHSDILSIAHAYLLEHNYTYMVHMEQDVVITAPIANHIVNTLHDENNNYAITDITGNDYFLIFSDIDISVFAINLKLYNNDSYAMYVASDNVTNNLLIQDHLKFNCCDSKIKPYLLKDLSHEEIYKLQNKLTQYVYDNDAVHWVHNYLNDANIQNLINPVYIDTGRTYPLHSYKTGKLSIIKGIQSYAKHLRQSRNASTAQASIATIDDLICFYGYSPYNRQTIPYYSKGLDIVIISKNQQDSIEKIMNALRLNVPTANRIFVLDRCNDGSSELLNKYNEYYIELSDRVGFCAGSARNDGLKLTNPTNAVLFLDGDRIPNNFNIERINQMLYYFDISLIANKSDIRSWFRNIPTININFNRANNNVWSSAILLRRSAINKISEVVGNGNLFDPIFDGHWGCEDEYLGDVANSLNMTCGGFPNFIYVDGETTTANTNTPEYMKQMQKRIELRQKLSGSIHENSIYMNKETRRLYVDNFIKHRNRVLL